MVPGLNKRAKGWSHTLASRTENAFRVCKMLCTLLHLHLCPGVQIFCPDVLQALRTHRGCALPVLGPPAPAAQPLLAWGRGRSGNPAYACACASQGMVVQLLEEGQSVHVACTCGGACQLLQHAAQGHERLGVKVVRGGSGAWGQVCLLKGGRFYACGLAAQL